jgi:putative copper resistance protein D
MLRTISWVAGVLLLFYITNGGLNVYETYLFSAHASAQMLLAVMVPLLLAPAAPVTLALTAIHERTDASRGPREWILLATRSRLAGYLSHPIVTGALFTVALWVFYYTPVLGWATTDQSGHEWSIVGFLVVGYLVVQSLIGVDPVPYRASFRIRFVLLAALAVAFALLGLAIAASNGLLLADWYGAMGRTWGQSALGDQHTGGLIALGVAETGAVILAVTLTQRLGHATRVRRQRQSEASRPTESRSEPATR